MSDDQCVRGLVCESALMVVGLISSNLSMRESSRLSALEPPQSAITSQPTCPYTHTDVAHACALHIFQLQLSHDSAC